MNTRPHLDGENDKFIDLMHFDPDGDRQLAETMFVGIKPVLEEDLSVRDRSSFPDPSHHDVNPAGDPRGSP